MNAWMRIPCAIASEEDRRKLLAILGDNELSVRVVRVKEKTSWKRYVEYRGNDGTEEIK